MLVLNPSQVTFAGLAWPSVESITVDRQATTLIEDYADTGPFCAFVDATAQRVTVTVRQSATPDEQPDNPKPGDAGELVWRTAFASGVGRSASVAAQCVVVAVAYAISSRASAKDAAVRTVTFRAVSPTGATDPLAVTRLPPG